MVKRFRKTSQLIQIQKATYMRKNAKPKTRLQKKKPVLSNNASEVPDRGKRKTFKIIRNSAIGLILTGGTASYFYNAYQTDLAERDLSKIGRGKPTIVQIHDPNCVMCTALQKATRSALSNFQEDDLQYLVANIRTGTGSQFANRYNVPHVTLLLFDKRGKLQNVLQGTRNSGELTSIFKELILKNRI